MDHSRRGPRRAPMLRVAGWRCPRLRGRILRKRKRIRSTQRSRVATKIEKLMDRSRPRLRGRIPQAEKILINTAQQGCNQNRKTLWTIAAGVPDARRCCAWRGGGALGCAEGFFASGKESDQHSAAGSQPK